MFKTTKDMFYKQFDFFCLPPSGGKQLDWNSDTF